jgi:hypothetical protein
MRKPEVCPFRPEYSGGASPPRSAGYVILWNDKRRIINSQCDGILCIRDIFSTLAEHKNKRYESANQHRASPRALCIVYD